MKRWLLAAAPAALLVGCGVSGSEIHVDIDVSGEGVDQAVIDFRGEVTTVDLPWSTTVTIKDERGVDGFSVIATNPTEAGALTCDAEWREATNDGTWSRTADYRISCGARVNFQDTGIVRLEPSGRSISFEERDAELAAEAAAEQAERERLAATEGARALALPALETVRVGDWDISTSGVLRDGEDYIEDLTGNTVTAGGVPLITEITATYHGAGTGALSNLSFTLIGGDTLEPYRSFEVSCGVIPDPVHGFEDPPAGTPVTFNVCWHLDESEAAQAFIEVDQVGGGVEAAPVRLLLPEQEGITGRLARAVAGEARVGDDWRIEVTDVRIDDLDRIRERQPDADEPRAGEAFVWIELKVTNVRDFGAWPWGGEQHWYVAAANGVSRYDVRDDCPRYPSPLTSRSLTDPPIEAGETIMLHHCWQVASEDVGGATLIITTPSGDAVLDLGL